MTIYRTSLGRGGQRDWASSLRTSEGLFTEVPRREILGISLASNSAKLARNPYSGVLRSVRHSGDSKRCGASRGTSSMPSSKASWQICKNLSATSPDKEEPGREILRSSHSPGPTPMSLERTQIGCPRVLARLPHNTFRMCSTLRRLLVRSDRGQSHILRPSPRT
jgi:hypothetical protein